MALDKLYADMPSETMAVVNALVDEVETLSSGSETALTFVSSAPANSTATGTKGDMFADASYLYICIDTNTWVQIAVDSSSF